MAYPKLPKSVRCPGGDVRVEASASKEVLEDDDESFVMGHFHMMERTIRLRKGMRLEQKWRTLFHELAHVWLSDAGLHNGLDAQMEEAICDAVASGMFRERFG